MRHGKVLLWGGVYCDIGRAPHEESSRKIVDFRVGDWEVGVEISRLHVSMCVLQGTKDGVQTPSLHRQ
jgi:hypothetical protein